jgi:hypothetical protein
MEQQNDDLLKKLFGEIPFFLKKQAH